MITVERIQPNARKVYGKVYQAKTSETYNAVIDPRKSIRIHGIYTNHVNGPQHFDRTFNIGDQAEYDSYNFNYVGTIVAIGAKTVTIEAHGRKHRLSLYNFSWRNWNFDLEKITRNNHETSMTI